MRPCVNISSIISYSYFKYSIYLGKKGINYVGRIINLRWLQKKKKIANKS